LLPFHSQKSYISAIENVFWGDLSKMGSFVVDTFEAVRLHPAEIVTGQRARAAHLRKLAAAALIASGVAVASPASANLVTNGNFGTGDTSGWSLTGGYFTGVCSAGTWFGLSICTASPGNFAMSYGDPGTEQFLSQSLPTQPGRRYNLQFVLRNDNFGSTPQNLFQVSWNSSNVYSRSNMGTFDYTEIDMNGLMATGASTALSFGGMNTPSQTYIDAISVVPAPEPASLGILGVGVIGLGLTLQRRGT
jgi:hypothetical protein